MEIRIKKGKDCVVSFEDGEITKEVVDKFRPLLQKGLRFVQVVPETEKDFEELEGHPAPAPAAAPAPKPAGAKRGPKPAGKDEVAESKVLGVIKDLGKPSKFADIVKACDGLVEGKVRKVLGDLVIAGKVARHGGKKNTTYREAGTPEPCGVITDDKGESAGEPVGEPALPQVAEGVA